MTSSKDKRGFFIGVTCPGCGGELRLQEDFFVLTCSHCGSALRVVAPDLPPAYLVESKLPRREIRFHCDRFLKEKNLPLTDSGVQIKNLYYPYWKVDAVLLRKRNKVVQRFTSDADDPYKEDSNSYEQRRTEINLSPFSFSLQAGCTFQGIPSSLGLRTGYVHVVPYSRENIPDGFDSLPVLTSWSEAVKRTTASAHNVGRIALAEFGRNRTELFRPVGSLIYFPYHVVESYQGGQFLRLVVDGVTGRVVSHVAELSAGEQGPPAEVPDFEFGQLTVDFHRCSNCGEDLPTEQSYVYICQNCNVLTILESNPLVAPEVDIVQSAVGDNDRLLPFWSFRLGGPDAARVQRLMGGIYNSEFFVVPAFRLTNFEAAYRLSKRMSAACARLEMAVVDGPDGRFLPVTVGPSEAIILGQAIIYREEISKDARSEPGDVNLQVQQARLFYAPFHLEQYFYVDSAIGAVTVEKSLVD